MWIRGVEVGDGKGVGDSNGVGVWVVVGDRVGDGVVVGGTAVNAVSGKDNCPGGTQAARSVKVIRVNNNTLVILNMFEIIPWIFVTKRDRTNSPFPHPFLLSSNCGYAKLYA